MDLRELVRGVVESEPGSDRFSACSEALANAAMANDRALAAEATQMIFRRIVKP